MNLRFLPLFTLRVAHSYYTGVCRDVAVVVPGETARLLRNGRLLAREVEGVLHVMYEAGDGDDPLVPFGGITLRLGLQLLNPHFGNFTELPPGFPALRPRFTNAADPRALAAGEGVTFVGETFSYALGEADRPAMVTLRDAAGTALRIDTVTAEDGRAEVSFDVRGVAAGLLEVEAEYPGPVMRTAALYLDAELRQRGAKAVVEITLDEDFVGDPPAFTVSFAARAEVLSYYLVVDGYSAIDLASLSVSDQGFTDDARAEVTFTRIEPPGPGDLPAALLAPGGEAVVVFRSQAPLARREQGRRRIQLSKNGDVLMANLPQPGTERAGADLILHLSKT
ncbi:MAG TPA: hypothetical protein VE913_10800 [Longimicrobium sp.]|nr:hypothetical protein [Longimicrobium sp.]